MRFLSNFTSRIKESSELVQFFWQAKMWFLIPFIILLIFFGFILIFAQSTGIAPFIYTLF